MVRYKPSREILDPLDRRSKLCRDTRGSLCNPFREFIFLLITWPSNTRFRELVDNVLVGVGRGKGWVAFVECSRETGVFDFVWISDSRRELVLDFTGTGG